MMTRSKTLILCTLLLATPLLGEVPANLFQSHRERILSGETSSVEGYTFGVGYATPRAATLNAKKIAKDRSALLAQSNLLTNIKLSGIVFPDWLTQEERRQLLNMMRKNLSATEMLEGLQTIHQEWNDTEWISVVAIPTAKLAHITPYTFKDVLKQCRAFLRCPARR